MSLVTPKSQALYNFYAVTERLIKLPPSPLYSILLNNDQKVLSLVTPHGIMVSFIDSLSYVEANIAVSYQEDPKAITNMTVSLLSLPKKVNDNKVAVSLEFLSALFRTTPESTRERLAWISINTMLDNIEKDLRVRKTDSIVRGRVTQSIR